MRAVALYDANGDYVITVLLPLSIRDPDIIRWGERYFTYSKGFYTEAMCYTALTREEHDSVRQRQETQDPVCSPQ